MPRSWLLVNPYGHVVFQAGRGDVHTEMVNGEVVKRDGKLVGSQLATAKEAVGQTVEYLQSTLGPDAWQTGMNPDLPGGELARRARRHAGDDAAQDGLRRQHLLGGEEEGVGLVEELEGHVVVGHAPTLGVRAASDTRFRRPERPQ